ncbi:hypothetical protein ACFQWF_27595 [Methylorubrum suomiense]
MRDLSKAITFSGLVVALAGSLLAWWLAGRLARPLNAVCAQADRLGRGEPLAVLAPTVVRRSARSGRPSTRRRGSCASGRRPVVSSWTN